MSDLTTVHLVRHGEVHNPSGVLYGRLPGYHLSERGQQMAQRIAEYLAEHDVAAVVSSPLERAVETASPIAARHGLEVSTDARLIEAENVFQGLTFGVGDGSLRRPSHWRHLYNPFRPSWGEPYASMAGRVLAAVQAAAATARGREVVMVSHQLPIWVTRCSLEGRRLWHDPRRRQCSLASITSVIDDDGTIVAVSYSEPARDLLPTTSHVVPGA